MLNKGIWGKSVRFLFSLGCTERKGEFWCSAFKTLTSNIIEWMLSLWVHFCVQYSLLLQYGILEKLLTCIFLFLFVCLSVYSLKLVLTNLVVFQEMVCRLDMDSGHSDISLYSHFLLNISHSWHSILFHLRGLQVSLPTKTHPNHNLLSGEQRTVNIWCPGFAWSAFYRASNCLSRH